jgi:hypothetical protein
MNLTDARIEQIDLEGLLAFSEHVLCNASALWTGASATDRRTLQAALFPEGLAWSPEGFGTFVTCHAFSYLRGISGAGNGVASPGGTDRLRTVTELSRVLAA